MPRHTLKIALEITVSTSAEAQAIVDAISALPGKFAAAEQSQIDAAKADLQAQLDAEKQAHADDLAAIQLAADSAAPVTS